MFVSYNLNLAELDSFHFIENIPQSIKLYRNEVYDRCDAAIAAVLEDEIETIISRHFEKLNEELASITITA